MYGIKKIKTAVEMVYNEPKLLLNPIQDLYSGFQQMSFKKTKSGIQSANFKTGSAGWNIKNTGNVEFNTGTFRGALEANSINIPDTTSANSFHVDNTGNAWWGATAIGSSVAKILNTGVATFANINITGGTGVANLSDAGALATLNTVGTAQIDALAVNDTKIASNAIIVGKIAPNVITATEIASATITSTEIAAGTITASNMNVSQLSAISADIGSINAGTVTGTLIQTDTTGQRIVLDGSGTNNVMEMYNSSGNKVIDMGSQASTFAYLWIEPYSDTGGIIVQNNSSVAMAHTLMEIDMLNSSSTGNAVLFSNQGSGNVLTLASYGAGSALSAGNQAISTSVLVNVNNGGTGDAIDIWNTNANNSNYCVWVLQAGLGRSIEIDQNNSSNINSVIYLSNQGSGLMMELMGNGTIKSRGFACTVNRTDAVNTNGGAILARQLGTSSIIDTNVSGCYLSNAGVWTDASSKKLKENFKSISVLDKLNKLDILEYNYISENINTMEKAEKHLKGKIETKDTEKEVKKLLKEVKGNPVPKHMTPMAEDFYKMFGLGDSNGISPNDTAGVALQAIKELNEKVIRLEKLLNNVTKH